MAKAVSINRSLQFEQIVQKIAGEKAAIYTESGKKLFPTIREFLTFCALLGYRHGNKKPIDKSLGTEDIPGVIYEDTEALEFIWLIGISETADVNLLRDGNERECANIFETYANGGLELISNKLTGSPEEGWYSLLFEMTREVADG